MTTFNTTPVVATFMWDAFDAGINEFAYASRVAGLIAAEGKTPHFKMLETESDFNCLIVTTEELPQEYLTDVAALYLPEGEELDDHFDAIMAEMKKAPEVTNETPAYNTGLVKLLTEHLQRWSAQTGQE